MFMSCFCIKGFYSNGYISIFIAMGIFQFCEQFSTTEHTIAYMHNRGPLRRIPQFAVETDVQGV